MLTGDVPAAHSAVQRGGEQPAAVSADLHVAHGRGMAAELAHQAGGLRGGRDGRWVAWVDVLKSQMVVEGTARAETWSRAWLVAHYNSGGRGRVRVACDMMAGMQCKRDVCLGVCNNRVVSCQPRMSVWWLGLVPVFVVSGSTCEPGGQPMQADAGAQRAGCLRVCNNRVLRCQPGMSVGGSDWCQFCRQRQPPGAHCQALCDAHNC